MRVVLSAFVAFLVIPVAVECSSWFGHSDFDEAWRFARRYTRNGETSVRHTYYSVNFHHGCEVFIPRIEGREQNYNLMAQRVDEIAVSDQCIPEDVTEKSIVRVDCPLMSGVLLLAVSEAAARDLWEHGNGDGSSYKRDLMEAFENYTDSCQGVSYEQVRAKVIEGLGTFPEGGLLSSGMYKTKKLPRVYCNYLQYKWGLEICRVLQKD